MRPNQQNRRMRGRNNNGGNNQGNNTSNTGGGNRKGPNPLTRSYESNGPDVKIRGSAQQVAEKYTTLARDATSAGDRVMTENYLQHAEHYNRIIAAALAQMPAPRDMRNDDDMGDEGDEDNGSNGNQQDNRSRHNDQSGDNGTGPQPVFDGVPAEVSMETEQPSGQQAPRRPRNNRRRDENRATEPVSAEAASIEAQTPDSQPVAAAADDEAPRRPRRPRRPRESGEAVGEEDGVKVILARGVPKQVAAVDE